MYRISLEAIKQGPIFFLYNLKVVTKYTHSQVVYCSQENVIRQVYDLNMGCTAIITTTEVEMIFIEKWLFNI